MVPTTNFIHKVFAKILDSLRKVVKNSLKFLILDFIQNQVVIFIQITCGSDFNDF